MVDVIVIGICLIILALIAKYITFAMNAISIVIPPIIMRFIYLAIAIAIVQYIIGRKDD